MTPIQFTLDMEPPTVTAQQQKTVVRNGKPCRYDTAPLAKAKRTYARALLPYKPAEPLQGALSLEVVFFFPYRANEPLKNRVAPIPKDTKPDTDNMLKALKDQMENVGFFVNDSQVSRELAEKYWSAKPSIQISLGRHEYLNN